MAALVAQSIQDNIESAWQGIATLKLRPKKSVHYYTHHYRGAPWLIIANQDDENHFRCSHHAAGFFKLLDGSRTVQGALGESKKRGSSCLSQVDVIQLIANLKFADLLEDDTELTEEKSKLAEKRATNRWLNPFAIKFALINPDKFLERTERFFAFAFNPVALFVWIAMVLTGLSTTVLNWQGLTEHAAARFTDPQNLFWYWLLYPLVKGLHELGHAYSTKHWGGTVREMGITFLVFFPVPYVDCSSSHRFESKSRRMLVCGSGIMVELLLAGIALFIWTNSDHGLVRDLAFDVVVIAGISTVLFNANPLLRFDGYYLLSEFLETPNLGTRSDQYLGYLFKRYALDMPDLRNPVSAVGEPKWLITYGICARMYRVFISFFIAFWVASKFLVVGTLLAIWALMGQIVYPLVRTVWNFIPQVIEVNRVNRLIGFIAATSTAVVALIFTPISFSTYGEGVVNLPEQAYIRAQTDGVVTRLETSDGKSTEQGDIILTLGNIELEARLRAIEARLEEVRAKQQSVFLSDRSQSEVLNVRAASLEADRQQLLFQISQLDVTSGTSGRVSLPLGDDLLGRHVSRGDVLGYVAGDGDISALVAIGQLDIDLIRRNLTSIEVKLGSLPDTKFVGKFIRELPQATDRLPNSLLGSMFGGMLKVDARDKSGTQLLSNVFLIEISLPLETSGAYLGQRVHVRFNHQKESLANRYLRRFRQFQLNHLFAA